jgi:hypothetical protein
MGGALFCTVVFLPAEIEARPPFDRWPRLRVEASVGGVPIKGTWMPSGDGRRTLMTPRKLLRRLRIGVGDGVADREAVDVPPALAEALEEHRNLREVRRRWTTGRRRGLAHRVTQARTEPTRRKRVKNVLAALADQACESAQSQ